MQHRLILPRFLVFYAGLFAAFGVASPFLPSLPPRRLAHRAWSPS